jgi:formylglycine-generating enzyme required for sulfatase activity
VLVLIVCAATSAHASAIEESYGRYHALVIGNNAYQHLTPLETAVTDAEAIAEVLRDRYGLEVTLLTDATRYIILTELSRLRRELKPSDNLLLYYAGHGYLDEITDTGYWLPVDAEEDSQANWIANTTITDAVKGFAAKHVMVVADSCYSGSLTRAGDVDLGRGAEHAEWLERMATTRSRTVLASGGLEPVTDSGGGEHSVFAREFIDTLARATQILDGQGLYDQIKHRVVVNADQTPRYDNIRKAGHDGGDFLFVPLSIDVTINIDRTDSEGGDSDALFWRRIQESDDPAAFRAYLEQFPNGTFATLARLKLGDAGSQADGPEDTQGNQTGAVIAESGREFSDCETCPTLIVIPAGEFEMGSPASEAGREAHEGPRHTVTIARPFALGKYEVTRAEFAAFVGETSYEAGPGCWYWSVLFHFDRARSWVNPGYEQTDGDPVACINWQDAQAYLTWLSRKTGASYRLPSEAEWEYAARAGSREPRYWGSNPDEACAYENVYDRDAAQVLGFPWANSDCADGYVRSAPVGSFAPNPFGLHDMLGNAPEWVMDCFASSYALASADGSPHLAGDCGFRVLRGGTWGTWPAIARAARRAADEPYERADTYSFRVLRELD